MGLNMYVCLTLVTINMHSLWMICASLCVFDISVQLCVFSACWVTPGPLRSCQCPALAPRSPRGFLQGYADKVMLLDWLTAPSVAGAGRSVLWIPSDGHEQFSVSLFSTNTHTNNVTSLSKPRISDGPSLRKKSPKSSLKSGSKT